MRGEGFGEDSSRGENSGSRGEEGLCDRERVRTRLERGEIADNTGVFERGEGGVLEREEGGVRDEEEWSEEMEAGEVECADK